MYTSRQSQTSGGYTTLPGTPEVTTWDIIDHLKECAVGGAELDIYQIAAFRYTANTNPRRPYYVSALKALLALCTQIVAMCLILWDGMLREFIEQYDDPPIPRSYLQQHSQKSIQLRILSILIILVTVLHLVQQFSSFTESGLYLIDPRDLRNKPDFVNSWWLTIGRYANIAVFLMVLYGSMFLIFHASEPIVIVLDSAALYFVLTLDDMFVRPIDYKDLATFLKTYQYQSNSNHTMSRCARGIHLILYHFAVFSFWITVAGTGLWVLAVAVTGSQNIIGGEEKE